ncbi:DMT family transporter [Spirochaeta isovalerica]|uniref:Drug/metabolite transporter (DMT)-like permease n=1 Tax=Spirochaeta isovalerica TaxID=150 RepID=A0A841RHE6_9SPIO|nr:DMT family transporter [Spirochaeta isovalerica]MBB6482607.1 drug/metabolite transporter (DMT)-like permease [Spirochaeta isovalerica]
MDKKRIKAEIFLVLVTIIWGGTFAIIKTGLEDSTPLMLLAVRFGAAFLIFSLLYFKKFKFNGKKTIINGIILGIFMFIGYAAQTVGLAYTTASKAGFISFTFALFVPFLQIWILKRKPFMGNVVGLIVVFAGIWIISKPTGGPFNVGDMIMLIAAVGYAFFIIFMDLINKKESPELMTSIQFLTTSLLSIIASFFLEEPKLNPTPSFLFSIAYLVILGSVFCLYMMNLYQKDTSPMRAVLIYSLEPVFGVIFAIILLGESFSIREVSGALLILGGVLLSELWEIIGIGKRRT